MQRMRKALLSILGICLLAPAPAEEAVDVDARIAQIRESSRELAALAAEPLPAFESAQERQEAEAYVAFLARAAQELDALASEWERTRVTDRSSTAAGGGAEAQPMTATRQIQAMNQSFNLQSLGLQQKLQDESRRFTLLSNIMKTKHDTAKNSISNVR